MLSALRRRFRSFYQRLLLLAILIGISIFSFSYLNLEFCYRIMSQSSFTYMCKKYKNHEYSGSLCEELCGNTDAFKDFKCPQNEMKTTIFTAVKNTDVYAIKLARHIKDDLTWTDTLGLLRYPKIEDFHHIVKMHITLSYNVTLDDTMIKALVSQEIDANSPEQMLSFWRLFNDNNYMMGKLFDEESLFPSVLGSCGPYYATENLNSLEPETGLKHFITIDWEGRLKFAMNIMEYLLRLEEVKPEPLRICKISAHLFGLTADKRIKYQSAEFIHAEGQIDKMLSDGAHCNTDADCSWHYCQGKCDPEKLTCLAKQQNNNLQIFCEQILKGSRLFPGLLATSRTPGNLNNLIANCINPSKNTRNHVVGRMMAPTPELGLHLYNELKRLQKSVSNGGTQYENEN